MKRLPAALLPAALAVAAAIFEISPSGAPVRAFFAATLAGNDPPQAPESVTAVELDANARGIGTLDAALILRAVLPNGPKAVAFLLPLRTGRDDALLLSRLAGSDVPVVFTSNERLDPMPRVETADPLRHFPVRAALVPMGAPTGGFAETAGGSVAIARRQGAQAVPSNIWRTCLALENVRPADGEGRIPGALQAGRIFAPLDAAGNAHINPLAQDFVRRISLGQLLLLAERNDRGLISPALEMHFRDRIVAVQTAGSSGAAGIAAVRNRLADRPLHPAAGLAGVLLALSIPWWPGGRRRRMLLALLVTCALLLAALGVYSALQTVPPLLAVTALPLLALIPGSNDRKRREATSQDSRARRVEPFLQ